MYLSTKVLGKKTEWLPVYGVNKTMQLFNRLIRRRKVILK